MANIAFYTYICTGLLICIFSMGLIYSTNPDFQIQEQDTVRVATPEPSAQKLTVAIDRRNRGGKQVTLVKGFKGDEEDLSALAKVLKTRCGVGGSAKDGEIIIQGDFREKLVTVLSSMGYGVKRGN